MVKELAVNNRLWGAERIRAELLKLDVRVSKTIQKYMKLVRPKRSPGQTWRIFLRNDAAEVWACDFLQVTDLIFRPLYAFCIIELRITKGDPCERVPFSDGSLGGATTAGSDFLWANTRIPHPE